MIRTLSTLLVLTVLAGPAAAQEVKVDLAGKDKRTIDLEIDRAAWTACGQAFLKSRIDFAEQADCAKAAAEDAQAQAKAYELAAAGPASVRVLASNDGRESTGR